VVIYTRVGTEEITLEHGVPTDKLDHIFNDVDREQTGNPEVSNMDVYYPSPFLEAGVVFVDTPGLGENTFMDSFVQKSISGCQGVLCVIDASHGFRKTVRAHCLISPAKPALTAPPFSSLLGPGDLEGRVRLRFCGKEEAHQVCVQ